MQITVSCPHCHEVLRLRSEMRGKSIACPLCSDVFTVVVEENEKKPDSINSIKPGPRNTPTGPSAPSRTGNVGDMIPILPTGNQPDPNKRTTGNPTPNPDIKSNPTTTPSWMEPPPVRRNPGETVSPASQRPASPPKKVGNETVRINPNPANPVTIKPPEKAVPTAPRSEAQNEGNTEPPVPAILPVHKVSQPTLTQTPQTHFPQSNPPIPEESALDPASEESDLSTPPRRGGKALLIVSLLFATLLTGGYFFFRWAVAVTEVGLVAQAQKAYQEHRLEEARTKYHRLTEQFSGSQQLPLYQLLEEVCTSRETIEDNAVPPLESFNALQEILKQHSANPLLKEYRGDIASSWVRRMKQFPQQAQESDPEIQPLIDRASNLTQEINSRWPGALAEADMGQIKEDLNQLRSRVKLWQTRQRYIQELTALTTKPGSGTYKEARNLIKRAEQDGIKDFGKDPIIPPLLQKILDGHRASVIYQREETGLGIPASSEESHLSLVVNPRLDSGRDIQGLMQASLQKDTGDLDGGIVLALSRGVLYGLRRTDGATLWATRVGVDTRILPVRVPATEATPERILVLSADTGTLIAMDRYGRAIWQYRIGNKCVARPVIVDQKAYLATLDGQIHEIELFEGKLLGRFELGSREKFTVGGSREGKSNRIYFPADETCVYVLDVQEKKCVGILYTNHWRGSLRGEPIIVPPEDSNQPGYLILNQQEGLEDMQLRVYSLPISDPNAAPISLKPPLQVQGWSWFPPCRDEEKIALVSDLGQLGLFGIKQPRNQDEALFPVYPAGRLGLSLDQLLPGKSGEPRGRSQVVQMQDDDYWVLAHGRLQRLQMVWKSSGGPQLQTVWNQPLDLGWQEHECQSDESPGNRRSTLYLVTRALRQSTMLATAVNDEDGRILWQRQLGLISQTEPLALTNPRDAAAAPLLLAMGQGGALLGFDPADLPASLESKDVQWLSGGKRVAGPLDENPVFSPQLFVDPDGHSAWQLSCPGRNLNQLILRHVGWQADNRVLEEIFPPNAKPNREPTGIRLSASPAGPASRFGNHLLIPLDNGILVRVSLQDGYRVDEGPSWRHRRLGPGTSGYVKGLGPDQMLVSDGLNGLAVYNWSAEERTGKRIASLQLKPEIRLKTAPVILPEVNQEGRFLLADSSGLLSLYSLRADRQLVNLQSWKLPGNLSSGPFVLSMPDGKQTILCGIDDQRLLCLIPEKSEPLWEYAHADLALVGTPQLVHGHLTLADKNGRFIALDPATGTEIGKEVLLPGSVAAAVSPVAYGSHWMFAPLTDGTILLLPTPKKP